VIDPHEVALRVQQIRDRGGPGEGSSPVAIIAVTKDLWSRRDSRCRFSAQCDAVGENYAQEVLAKGCRSTDRPAGAFHRRDSVQQGAPVSPPHLVVARESTDGSVISEIGKRAPGAEILLQVNTTNEDTKSGVAPAEVESLLAAGLDAGLVVRGLMTIGPTSGNVGDAERAFLSLRSLADSLNLPECSMGMSDDYQVAVACGSTMIRIGSRALRPPNSALKNTRLPLEKLGLGTPTYECTSALAFRYVVSP
jgi:PLP dependent protein